MSQKPKKQSPIKAQQTSVNSVDRSNLQAIHIERSELFIGPIPPPEKLEKYKQIGDDVVDRILKMAEQEQHHQQTLESQAFVEDAKAFGRGQWFAFTIALATLGCAVALVILNKPVEAAVFGGAGILSLVGTFLQNRFLRESRSESKQIATETKPLSKPKK